MRIARRCRPLFVVALSTLADAVARANAARRGPCGSTISIDCRRCAIRSSRPRATGSPTPSRRSTSRRIATTSTSGCRAGTVASTSSSPRRRIASRGRAGAPTASTSTFLSGRHAGRRGREEVGRPALAAQPPGRRGGPHHRAKGGVSDYEWAPDSTPLVLVVSDPEDEDEAPPNRRRTPAPDKPPSTNPPRQAGRKAEEAEDAEADRDRSLHVQARRRRLSGQAAIAPVAADARDAQGRRADQRRSTTRRCPRGRPTGSGSRSSASAAPIRIAPTTATCSSWTRSPAPRPRAADHLHRARTMTRGRRGARTARSIAYLQGSEPRFFAYNLNQLAVVPAAGGAPRILTASLDRAVSSPRWTPDGSSLLFVIEDDRAQHLGRIKRQRRGHRAARRRDDAVLSEFSISRDGRIAALSSVADRARRSARARRRRRCARCRRRTRTCSRELRFGHHRGCDVHGEGRHDGQRRPGQAGRLSGGPTLPAAARHPRRAERPGRAGVHVPARALRRARLRRARRELPRQLGSRAPRIRRRSSPTGATRRSSTCSPASTG